MNLLFLYAVLTILPTLPKLKKINENVELNLQCFQFAGLKPSVVRLPVLRVSVTVTHSQCTYVYFLLGIYP